jgi:hypothetical protein
MINIQLRTYLRALRERIATRLHPALHRDREGDIHVRATRVDSGAALIQGKPRAFLALVPARGESLHVPLSDRVIRELPAQLKASREDAHQLARDIQTDGRGPVDDADDESEREFEFYVRTPVQDDFVGVCVRPDESVSEAIDRATAGGGDDSADGEGEDSDGSSDGDSDESERETTHIPIDGVDGDDQEGDDG